MYEVKIKGIQNRDENTVRGGKKYFISKGERRGNGRKDGTEER